MTDKIKEYKCVAKTEFVQGNYAIAFQTLWGAGVDEFILYGQKEEKGKINWFAHEVAGRQFWRDFVLQECVFTALLSADSAEQLLHVYFPSIEYLFQNLNGESHPPSLNCSLGL
jgi:hypothetical protein